MSDPDDDDMLAAEFVLGTLDVAERTGVERRLPDDRALRDAVASWDARLSPLLGLYAAMAPPAALFSGLLPKLDGPAPPVVDGRLVPNVIALQRKVKVWRAVAAGAMAMAATLLVWVALPAPQSPSGRFVAVLQRDADSPAILLSVDVASRKAEIRQVSSQQPSGGSYELWLINPEVGPPRSLGVVRSRGVTDTSLASFDAAVIARATYAITVEPPGGSPNGVPSGPPVLTGKLMSETP